MKLCSITGCNKIAKGFGLYCSAHYEERRKYGRFLSLEERAANKKKCIAERAKKQKDHWADPIKHAARAEKLRIAGLAKRTTCTVEGCDQRARGHGLCPKHLHHLKKYGDPLAGPTRPNRGTGVQYSCWGYRQIKCAGHPAADHHGYVMEHRLVMEKHLGRLLAETEVVHHKDGNKANNEIENLELFVSHSAHVKEHSKTRLEKFGSYGFEAGRDRVLKEKRTRKLTAW